MPDPTQNPGESDEDDPMVSVTMRRSAAMKFYRALIRGSVRVEDIDSESAEWLSWGAGRVAYADSSVVDPEGRFS